MTPSGLTSRSAFVKRDQPDTVAGLQTLPLVAEDVKTKPAYINDFSCGFIAGEFNTLSPGCEDSIPWLAGDIASGVVVVGDIRDALGSAIKGDVVGVGLSLVSLVPYAGDRLNTGVKISRFLARIQPDHWSLRVHVAHRRHRCDERRRRRQWRGLQDPQGRGQSTRERHGGAATLGSPAGRGTSRPIWAMM